LTTTFRRLCRPLGWRPGFVTGDLLRTLTLVMTTKTLRDFAQSRVSLDTLLCSRLFPVYEVVQRA